MPQKIIDELNTEGRQESAREKAGRKGADRYSRQKETRYTEALKSENTALGKSDGKPKKQRVAPTFAGFLILKARVFNSGFHMGKCLTCERNTKKCQVMSIPSCFMAPTEN